MSTVKCALLSVTDKSGIEDFASQLAELGIELLSTGGTARKLRDKGLSVTDVSAWTGSPEMLDGRVKTLHPKVHGAILHQRSNTEHQRQCQEHGIGTIDLVVVNLYAFSQAVARPGCCVAEAVEYIDVGGPTLLRAAAKNFMDVSVIVDPADYPLVIKELRENGNTLLATRFYLAQKVFTLTASYDKAIREWMETVDTGADPSFSGED
ncbi:MAG: IMP cyclohydrolase [Desulfobulbus propionicus]|nr:MAG: IMP cyclohydrolase [Desulfobulbus propionicus]